jgi:hypothetical protein
MKSKLCLLFLTITSFTVYFGSSTSGQARDKSVLSPGPVRPGGLDYRAELPQGYLKVYSATDKFDDGGVQYYAHSSYAIYTINGKLLKNVENHISRSDEIPEIVSLPVGSYTVIARSERDGYVRVSVVIKEGQRTILDLDLGQRRLSSGYHTINRSNPSSPNVNPDRSAMLAAV